MLSRGGKIEYRCAHCDSPDIYEGYHQLMGMSVYSCRSCGIWEQWKYRKKIPLKNAAK